MSALLLYPATPGWGVRCGHVCLGSGFGFARPFLARVLGCACLCARSACTPPLLAGVCGEGVCAWARVLPAPRDSWLGCWGVCVCLCARSACTPPLLAGVCGVAVCAWALVSAAPRLSWLECWGVCAFACALLLYPATPGWGLRRGCVCLGSGFGCAPLLLAGVLGCVCPCVRAPLVPRHSWLGSAAWVCVLGLSLRLRPATPGWAVGVCVPLCARSTCTPPVLDRVRGVWVWCCLAPVLVPWFLACCERCPGLRQSVAVVAWHLSVSLGCGRWRASVACPVAPRGAPRLVRSGALGAPVGFPAAVVPFPTPGACAPGFTGWLHGARGGWLRTGLIVPATGPRRGRGAGLAPRRTRSGPAMGLFVAGTSGVGLGLRALRWMVCVDPVTEASGLPYRPSSDRAQGRRASKSATQHRTRGAAAQHDRTRENTAQRAAAQDTTRPAAQGNSAPQNSKGNSTTHSNAPVHQAPETAQTKSAAQRQRTSTAQHSTTRCGEDKERTARHPRTHTAQSTAASNSTQQHTTAKHTPHREHCAEKHDKTRCRKAQHPRATDSARGHNTASDGTKQNQTKQPSTARREAKRRS